MQFAIITPPPYEPAYVGVLTAVDDAAPNELQLTLSPNPSVGGLVHVSLQNRLGLPAVFSVLDNQGRMHQRIEKSQLLDQQHFQLDLSSQPAGLYFIRAESGGQQITRKVVRE
ncbi:T9SS type A sorting domain-containing protein [Fibrella sp. HMF5335]|uniref:T9SS type A sorting domain-containing protein n=1 Tax=Fibrella rubiginis TaxID=2817060 RepID=A0A939GJ90_9BACT|nr:T9SS type A sorting domain-containing protein [Fibrella rubiginis]MBO0937776.1 T9SS type A sorting domain-containing protein [Fibrella rubiginis]